MRDHRPVVSEVRSAGEYNFNAIAVEVEYSSIEVALIASAACRRSIGSTSGIQSGRVEVSNGRTTCSGECDVCCAGFNAGLLLVEVYMNMDRQAHPGVSWQRKKSASRIPKPT